MCAATLGGCMPFILPPGQASAGAATTGASPKPAPRTPDDERGTGTLRAGMHPLGFLESERDRRLDFGAGYVLERVARDDGYTTAHGPYIELDAFPLRAHADIFTARFGVRTMVEALTLEEAGEWGGGATVALAAELTGFASGPFGESGSKGAIVGVAHGEAGLGAYAGVSHRRFSDDQYWLASAGLSLRVPFAAGVVCCFVPR